jgi:hypothetical protein
MARPAEVVYWYRLSWNAAIALIAPFVVNAWYPNATRWVTALSAAALLGLGISAWRRYRATMLTGPH